MTMEAVLQKLESRIEDFVEAHRASAARLEELETRISELEEQLESAAAADDRVDELESQRDAMAERLEKVLAHIDAALDKTDEDD